METEIIFHQGRTYIARNFETEAQANAFMESEQGLEWGVLFEDSAGVWVASIHDMGEPVDELPEYAKFRAQADTYTDRELLKGELWLFFRNEADFRAVADQVKHYPHVRGFKSPDGCKQLKYTIHFANSQAMEFFEEKENAQRLKKALEGLGVPVLSARDYGAGLSVAVLPKEWGPDRLNAAQPFGSPIRFQFHPLSNEINNHVEAVLV